jgi:hypothetical protein
MSDDYKLLNFVPKPHLNSKIKFLLILFFAGIFVYTVAVHANGPNGRIEKSVPSAKDEDSFYVMAQKAGTDKVIDHQYQHAYETYLPKYRHKPIKMLEIGLGCEMTYGPGKSANLWTAYFDDPRTEIYFLEYNKPCLDKWKEELPPRVKAIDGDQSNVDHLKRMIYEFGGGYDIIVDDGGHHQNMIITSLKFLWPYLKPGGIYVIEDLHTSYMEYFNGYYHLNTTAVEFIKNLIDEMYYNHKLDNVVGVPPPAPDSPRQVLSVNCFLEICIIQKAP